MRLPKWHGTTARIEIDLDRAMSKLKAIEVAVGNEAKNVIDLDLVMVKLKAIEAAVGNEVAAAAAVNSPAKAVENVAKVQSLTTIVPRNQMTTAWIA